MDENEKHQTTPVAARMSFHYVHVSMVSAAAGLHKLCRCDSSLCRETLIDGNYPTIETLSLCAMRVRTNLAYSSGPNFATPSEMRTRLNQLTFLLHFPGFCGRRAESRTVLNITHFITWK
jgi:hypothetical protein